MRYGIFSDIHSNLEAFDAVIEAYKKEAIGRYLCVGDVVGYAANPRECIEKAKGLAMITIAGNHDWAAVDLFAFEYFNPAAKEAILWTRHKLNSQERLYLESLRLLYKNEDLTLVHGTLDNPQDFNYMIDYYSAEQTFGLQETNICFVGHSHVAGIFIKDKNGNIDYRQDDNIELKPEDKYIVNVGSIGQPRDGDPRAAYCIYDTDKKTVHTKRIKYDIETARQKIFDAGLPRVLGDRLLVGR
jgi:predicted phosphodiesterase